MHRRVTGRERCGRHRTKFDPSRIRLDATERECARNREPSKLNLNVGHSLARRLVLELHCFLVHLNNTDCYTNSIIQKELHKNDSGTHTHESSESMDPPALGRIDVKY